MKYQIKIVLLIVVGILLCSCSTPLKIKFNTSSNLNPDEQNRSLPVEVVIYQLRDDQVFRQATFQELWQEDRATLANNILSRREINIIPGNKTQITLDRKKEAAFIGVVAIFRNPHGGSWRSIRKIGKGVPLTSKHIVILLRGNRIKFE